jgi:phosphoenolpyruvate carboxylase
MELSALIRLLGELLGEVITEQESRDLFDVEERIRAAAKARRAGDPDAAAQLEAEVSALAPDTARGVASAFTLYFDLVNLAEEVNRVQVLREIEAHNHPQPIG